MVTEWKEPFAIRPEQAVPSRRFLGYDEEGQPKYADERQKQTLTPWEWEEWYKGGRREAWEDYLRLKEKRDALAGLNVDLDSLASEAEAATKDTVVKASRAEALSDVSVVPSTLSAGRNMVDIMNEQAAEIAKMEADLAAVREQRIRLKLEGTQQEYDLSLEEYHEYEKRLKERKGAIDRLSDMAIKTAEKLGEAYLTQGSITPDYGRLALGTLEAVAGAVESYTENVPGTIGALVTGKVPGTGTWEAKQLLQAVERPAGEEALKQYFAERQKPLLERVKIGRDEFNREVEGLPFGQQLLIYAVYDPLTYAGFGTLAKAATFPIKALADPASRAALVAAGVVNVGEAVDYTISIPLQAMAWLASRGGRKGLDIITKAVKQIALDAEERKLLRQAAEATADLVKEAESTVTKTEVRWDGARGSYYFLSEDGTKVYWNDVVSTKPQPEAPVIEKVIEGAEPGTIGEATARPIVKEVRTAGGLVYDEEVPVPVKQAVEKSAKPAQTWKLTFKDGEWGYDIQYADGTVGRIPAPEFRPAPQTPQSVAAEAKAAGKAAEAVPERPPEMPPKKTEAAPETKPAATVEVRAEGGLVVDEQIPVEVRQTILQTSKPASSWRLSFHDGQWGWDIYYKDGTVERVATSELSPSQPYLRKDDKGAYLTAADGEKRYVVPPEKTPQIKPPPEVEKTAESKTKEAGVKAAVIGTAAVPAVIESREGRPPSIMSALPVALAVGLIAAGGKNRAAAMARQLASQTGRRLEGLHLPTNDEIISARLDPDWFRKVSENFGSTPVGKHLLGLINPSGRPQDEIGKAALVRLTVLDKMESIKGVMMAFLRMQEDPIKLFGIGKDLKVTKVTAASPELSMAWGDVMQAAMTGRYILTPEQKQYVETLYAVEDAIKSLLKQEGIDIPDLSLAEGMHYVARRVEYAAKAKTGKAPRIGIKMSAEKERFYEYMSEGLIENVPYMRDPNRVIEEAISAAGRRIADKRLADIVAPMGRTISPKESPGFAETALRHPAFSGRVFPIEVANRLYKEIGDAGNAWLKKAGEVSGVLRTLQAALDFSAPFLQGLPILGRRPDIWAKATLKHIEAFIDPHAAQVYLAQNSDTIIKAVSEGNLYIGEHEYFAGTEGIQKLLSKLPGRLGETAAQVGKQTYGRASASFSAFGDIARVEMWKALAPRFVGREHQLGMFINRMTGVISSRGLGISPTQREFENAWLFFAPRYTRAGLALMGDLLRGGKVGIEAWKSLAGLAGGGMAFYYAVCGVMGEEPHINPTTDGAKFMSIRIGDHYVGVGGFITAVVRMMGDIAYDLNQEDAAQRIFPVKQKDEPLESYITRVRQEQPFVKFWFSRAAPLTGTVVNIIEGRDFLGRPFEEFGDYVVYTVKKFAPIGIAGGFEGGFDPVAFAASEAGLRSWPMSPFDQRAARREEVASAMGKKWEELPALEQKRLEESDPELKRLNEEIKKRREVKAGLEQITKNRFDSAMETARNRFNEAVRLAAKEINDPAAVNYQDFAVFKEKVQNAGRILGDRYDEIYSDPEIKAMLDRWSRLAKEKWEELSRSGLSRPIEDVAYEEYLTSVVLADDLEDEYGNYDFEKADARMKAIREKWGEDVWKYIQEYRYFGKDLPQEYWDYIEAREKLKPYWTLEEGVMKVIEKRYPNARTHIENYKKLSRFHDADWMEAARLKYPEIDAYNKLLNYTKERYRIKHPDIDGLLVKYYRLKPITLQKSLTK